jgi:glutaredoxin
MVTVAIYSKSECCLCDDAKSVLRRVQADEPFDLQEIDIESDPELMRRFGEQIPVVYVGRRKAFKFRVDEAELRRKLARERAA